MSENDYTNKNLAEFEAIVKKDEKNEKIKNRNRKLTGFIAVSLIVFLVYYVIQGRSAEGLTEFLVILLIAPFIFILALDTIVRSIINIKKLDKIDWVFFILNLIIGILLLYFSIRNWGLIF